MKVIGLEGVPVPPIVKTGTVLESVSKNWPLVFSFMKLPLASDFVDDWAEVGGDLNHSRGQSISFHCRQISIDSICYGDRQT